MADTVFIVPEKPWWSPPAQAGDAAPAGSGGNGAPVDPGAPTPDAPAAAPSDGGAVAPEAPAASPPGGGGAGPPPERGRPGPLTGRLLRHFRVGRRLAQGGMGEVYLAFDTALERPVAVKVVRPDLAGDAVQRTLFLREARAQARVVHPHVAQVYFAGEEEGLWFLAMQLLEGGSLASVLAEQGRLEAREALRHMLAVAEGLGEAARLGIVHRDVKPANILLDRSGEALIADFGLASLAAPAVAGTFEYMAPEQLAGGPVDARADMYALGATFYHLLAGRPPLTAATLQEAQAAHAGPPPAPLRRACPAAPRALAHVVDRCLAREPERRFASFTELVQALRRARPQPEVRARALSRLLAWAFDLAPALLVLRYTYATWPPAALAAELALAVLGASLLGATPGAWLLRLRLRTASGEGASATRTVLRAFLQHGWLLPLGLFLRATYGSSRYAEDWGLLSLAWVALSAAGSLAILGGPGQALHDRLTGVRLLVDLR